jgi:uncharacterized protein YcaQ
MYKPVPKRRCYLALPIPERRRAPREARRDGGPEAGVLRVDAIHQDVPFDGETAAGVRAEIDELTRWLGLEVSLPACGNSRVPSWRTTASRTT